MQYRVQIQKPGMMTVKAINKEGDVRILYHIPIIDWNNYIRGTITEDDLDISPDEKQFLKNG